MKPKKVVSTQQDFHALRRSPQGGCVRAILTEFQIAASVNGQEPTWSRPIYPHPKSFISEQKHATQQKQMEQRQAPRQSAPKPESRPSAEKPH